MHAVHTNSSIWWQKDDTRIPLYKKQTQKSSMSLPPDTLSSKQAIKCTNYQSYFWTRCSEKNLCPRSFEINDWF